MLWVKMKQVRREDAGGEISYSVIREAHIGRIRFEQKSADSTEQATWILGEENQYRRTANTQPPN